MNHLIKYSKKYNNCKNTQILKKNNQTHKNFTVVICKKFIFSLVLTRWLVFAADKIQNAAGNQHTYMNDRRCRGHLELLLSRSRNQNYLPLLLRKLLSSSLNHHAYSFWASQFQLYSLQILFSFLFCWLKSLGKSYCAKLYLKKIRYFIYLNKLIFMYCIVYFEIVLIANYLY